jgi:hypothetical protein
MHHLLVGKRQVLMPFNIIKYQHLKFLLVFANFCPWYYIFFFQYLTYFSQVVEAADFTSSFGISADFNKIIF